MRPRIQAELALLREAYGDVGHEEAGGEDWFRLPTYSLPEGWSVNGERRTAVPIVFLIKADYPSNPAYGFLTPAGLTFKGETPQNTADAPGPVPFEGDWMLFSWYCKDWQESSEARQGSNLLSWCRSFATRLSEGA